VKRHRFYSPLLLLLACFAMAACVRSPDDETLATNIKAALYSDPLARTAALQVTVKNGEATLQGTVPDNATREASYHVASRIRGVNKVNDQMTLEMAMVPPGNPPASGPSAPASAPRKRAHYRTARPENHVQEAHPPAAQPEEQRTAAPAPTVAEAPVPPPPPPPPKPRKFVLPSGTPIQVRMVDSIDSKTSGAGTLFRASLESPLQVDGEEVVPREAQAYVLLTHVNSAGHILGRSELKLELATLIAHGRTYTLSTTAIDREGHSRGKQSAARIGGTSAFGAVIGALAGGPIGAAIGATAGAAGGTGFQMITHGQQIRIPSETVLRFRLEEPVTITLPPESSGAAE